MYTYINIEANVLDRLKQERKQDTNKHETLSEYLSYLMDERKILAAENARLADIQEETQQRAAAHIAEQEQRLNEMRSNLNDARRKVSKLSAAKADLELNERNLKQARAALVEKCLTKQKQIDDMQKSLKKYSTFTRRLKHLFA